MNIQRLRQRLGISQRTLAQRLQVQQSTVAMWETGKNHPRANMLPRLAKALGCTIDDLYKAKTAPKGGKR